MLSILIPTFNDECFDLVKLLSSQATNMDMLDWEIIVADDGSTDADVINRNQSIEDIERCRFIRRPENIGRAAIRNFLVTQAHGDWLLFIDADMSIVVPNYLENYVKAKSLAHVVYGGYVVKGGNRSNLRYVCESCAIANHTAELRNRHPYLNFHTSNFMITRQLMSTFPYDERFRFYGYEDVLFGKQLCEHGVDILHIDNPVGFCTFEDNADFLRKTEEGLRTLRQFRNELRGYSPILFVAEMVEKIWLRRPAVIVFRVLKKCFLKTLTSNHPKTWLFKLYKLGYYLSLA